MSGRNFLFVPGPTNIPDRVQRAMVVAMEDHRSSRFPELALSVLAELKKVFMTHILWSRKIGQAGRFVMCPFPSPSPPFREPIRGAPRWPASRLPGTVLMVATIENLPMCSFLSRSAGSGSWPDPDDPKPTLAAGDGL
jgi:hypothetical protein